MEDLPIIETLTEVSSLLRNALSACDTFGIGMRAAPYIDLAVHLIELERHAPNRSAP